MDVSSRGGLFHFLVSGTDPSITDVFPDVVIKENGILRDHPDVRTERALLYLCTKAQIQAVYKRVNTGNN